MENIKEEIDKLFKEVTEITYENFNDGFDTEEEKYSIDTLIIAIEELIFEYRYLEEEYRDLERDVEENYTPNNCCEIDEWYD